jgi:hypothetical protein
VSNKIDEDTEELEQRVLKVIMQVRPGSRGLSVFKIASLVFDVKEPSETQVGMVHAALHGLAMQQKARPIPSESIH